MRDGVTPITIETVKATLDRIEALNKRVPRYIKVKQSFMQTLVKNVPMRPITANDIGLGFDSLYGLRVVVDDSISDDYEVVYDEGDEA